MTVRRADRLAGAVGLLLGLVLIVGSVMPAYAQGVIPSPPHGFAGTVSTLSPAGPVPEGTLVQGFVDGELRGETTTDAEGKYVLLVSGPAGTVTFKVAGVTAHESVAWVSAQLDEPFDLTIDALPTVNYSLTMAVAPAGAGTATDVSGASPYSTGVTVSIRAVAGTGYQFSHWTASPAVVFADASAATTTFTMPEADVTVTANFEERTVYTLTMAVSPIIGGTATASPAGPDYEVDAVINIQASAASGYQFSHWTAGAGVLGNPNLSLTTFTMPATDVTVTATFTVVQETIGGVCFIATAAYGTPAAEQIDVLREFRDVVLLPNRLGSEFVSLYYKTSPPVAEFISRHEVLKAAVRVGFIDPIVAVLNWSYALWSEEG